MSRKNLKYMGIDIGGTFTRAVVFSGQRIIHYKKYPTPRTRTAFIATLKQTVNTLSKMYTIKGVGISAAGTLRGNIWKSSSNIRYIKNFNFRKTIPPGLPLKVENDARCFARTELKGKNARKKVVVLTIGTGIGRAYGDRGKIKNPKRFGRSELWEGEYQKIRDACSTPALVRFLGAHIAPLLKKFSPHIVVCAGGVLERKNFFTNFKKELSRRGIHATIRQGRLGDAAAAYGATLLFKE